ncbi:unnamed protein product [Linum trigynum]|uniref:Cytochrome P450 n=1 Tax=Linum trigynum TaxID=586398 RepID=A0AAV2FW80_9ROSI
MMMIHISSISPTLLLIPILLFLASFIWCCRVLLGKRSAAAPPGPWKLPVIGNLHQLMFTRGRAPHIRLRELAHRYGPVMSLQIGEVANVIISSPEAAKLVLKTHDLAFASRPSLLAANIIFYGFKDVGFAPYGEYWRQMRKICIMELLSARRVSSCRSIREEEVSNLVSRIRVAATIASDEEGVDIREMLLSLASNVTSRSAFGKLPTMQRETFLAVIERIVESFEGIGLSDLFPSLKFIPVITGYQAKLMAIHQRADSVLEEIIRQHRDKTDRKIQHHNDDEGDDDKTEDIVDILLSLQRTGGLSLPLTTDGIKAVILDVFTAGMETTASTIEWTMSELVQNPNVLRLAQEEVRRVFGDKGNVCEDRLHELTYLDAVIKESMRINPHAPFLLPRETRETVEINGFVIPAKTRVIVNAWAIGRDPCHWIDPEKFYPERFLNSSIDYKGAHFEYIPFGAGRRSCPGMLFGMATVHLSLANLLFHFDWKLPVGRQHLDLTEQSGLSLSSKQLLRLIPITASN